MRTHKRHCTPGLNQLPTATRQSRFLFAALLLCLVSTISPAQNIPTIPGYYIAGKTGEWPAVLSSIGIQKQGFAAARVLVAAQGSHINAGAWLKRVDEGAILILEGDSEAGRTLGFHPTENHVSVKHLGDTRQPNIEITWEEALDVPIFLLPKEAQIFSREAQGDAPLLAGLRRGKGAVLWLAAPLGSPGYARFPFLLQALADLGLQPLFESRRLWAYADPAYLKNVPVEKLAHAWRQAGLATVHVSAWYDFDPDPQADAYLQSLIAACHREGILVYAWLELPHVSKKFWDDHEEWREITALQQEADVDWRLLMNLLNPDCHRAVAEGIHQELMRFDWDGVDFAELYFDGASGINNLEEFTPLSNDVRHEVQQKFGFDPVELFSGAPRNPRHLREFLDYRVELVTRLQNQWMEELEHMRQEKPHLDLALTQVDSLFDKSMHDAIGADAARQLRLLDRYNMTFIIEDPGTVWNQGPKRYATIAGQYRPLTAHKDRLGVDINIVERDQVVYPTQQQTGTELAQLIHIASQSFSTVIFYSAASVAPVDIPLLPAAAARVKSSQAAKGGAALLVDTPFGIGVRWSGGASVDGHPWPVGDSTHVWLPGGKHTLVPADHEASFRVLDFNGALQGASLHPDGVEISYTSQSRALMKLDHSPVKLMIDGKETALDMAGDYVVMLPRGKHTAVVTMQ